MVDANPPNKSFLVLDSHHAVAAKALLPLCG
jgi:hypothetical protein